ncbi:MAG: hypothetical protein IIB13_07425, partial [Chloroflexi bacterium]|nr:hypothetical protein [Chloroflexota bacterium]
MEKAPRQRYCSFRCPPGLSGATFSPHPGSPRRRSRSRSSPRTALFPRLPPPSPSTPGFWHPPSAPADSSIAVIEGLADLAGGLEPALSLEAFAGALDVIVHGTTVTTNAILTRGGAKTALLTTQGVRDALEMRRGIREEQYNNRLENVVPLVPRYLRAPIKGRL